MGQKTSPIGFRTGITLDWRSKWYASKSDYGAFLVQDHKIRDYVDRKYNRRPPYAAVAKVEIARTRNQVNVTLHTARPGLVIGPRGAEVDKLREEIEELTGRTININVIEIKEPALDATLVAEAIAGQLKKRASFRRMMKQQCELAMEAGAKGVKIICSGRLGGAEMARRETQKLGSIPLQTLDSNVDYAVATAKTTYGAVGVKAWIYKGKFGEVLEPRQKPRRPRMRRGGPGAREQGGRRGGGAVKPRAEAPQVAKQDKAGDKAQASESAAPATEGPKSDKTE